MSGRISRRPPIAREAAKRRDKLKLYGIKLTADAKNNVIISHNGTDIAIVELYTDRAKAERIILDAIKRGKAEYDRRQKEQQNTLL